MAVHGPADPLTAVYLHTVAQADALRASGFDVDIITPEQLLFGRWHRLAPILLPLGLLSRRTRQYDLFIFHSYLGWAFHALRRSTDSHRRQRTITMFHGLEPLYAEALVGEMRGAGVKPSLRFDVFRRFCMPALLRMTCRASDAVFCLNDREARYLTTHAWTAPDRVVVVQNGVDDRFFLPRQMRPRVQQLLFVGQWLLAKGIRYLVQGFTALALRRPAVRLMCVGTGASAPEVLAAFPAAVRSRVDVVPRVSRAEMATALMAADIFVFPSLSEGASGALLEAMASGLPIVTTPAGNASELLEDGQAAVLVPFADAGSIAAAVERLMDDAPLRQRLGAGARRRAETCRQDAADAAFRRAVVAIMNDQQSINRGGDDRDA